MDQSGGAIHQVQRGPGVGLWPGAFEGLHGAGEGEDLHPDGAWGREDQPDSADPGFV